jgi:hypothetical protein
MAPRYAGSMPRGQCKLLSWSYTRRLAAGLRQKPLPRLKGEPLSRERAHPGRLPRRLAGGIAAFSPLDELAAAGSFVRLYALDMHGVLVLYCLLERLKEWKRFQFQDLGDLRKPSSRPRPSWY